MKKQKPNLKDIIKEVMSNYFKKNINSKFSRKKPLKEQTAKHRRLLRTEGKIKSSNKIIRNRYPR